MLVGLERPGDGLLNTITYLTDEICSLGATHFKHHSASRCNSSVDAKRLCDGSQHGIEADAGLLATAQPFTWARLI